MRRSVGSSLRSSPSSVRISSPGRARRTTTRLSASVDEVEGVQWVAEREHDVVRHVDDVRDRAHPGRREPSAHPGRRGADLDVAEEAADVARAALQILDPDVHRFVADLLRVVARRRSEVEAEQRGDVARHAVDREEIDAVVRHLQADDRLAERKDVGEGRARLAGGENEDSAVVRPELELALGEDHPLGDLAAELGALELRPARQHRPGKRHRDGRARAEVPGAAHDLDRLPFAHVHAAELQPVGVRMLARLEHVAHAVEPEVPVDVGDADPLDVLHHADGDVDARDELVERELTVGRTRAAS